MIKKIDISTSEKLFNLHPNLQIMFASYFCLRGWLHDERRLTSRRAYILPPNDLAASISDDSFFSPTFFHKSFSHRLSFRISIRFMFLVWEDDIDIVPPKD